MKNSLRILIIGLAATLILGVPLLSGCSSQREGDVVKCSDVDASAYDDPRWPTTDAELLAIPENERWYNAWDGVESYCTVTGPVVSVQRSQMLGGEAVFISIGEDFGGDDAVELAIWNQQDQENFAQMIEDLETQPNGWITVSGYLSTYNRHLQFDANGGVKCEWKTGVE